MGKAGPGFKKPKTKKYFSKKDIVSGVIVLAIVALVVAVMAVVISRDDFIRTVDGKLEMEPNWLIANYSDTSSAMYYKVGEVGEIAGYSLDAASAQSSVKSLTPDSEDALIKSVYMGSYDSDYATVAESMANFYTDVEGPVDIACLGRSAKYITSFTSAEDAAGETDETEDASAEETEEAAEAPAEETEEAAEAPAEETEETAEASEEATDNVVDEIADLNSTGEDMWVMIAYIDYDADHCVYIQLNSDVELSQADAEAQLALFAESLTLVER